MKHTDNFNLKKPEQTDFYNVEDFNENAEIIDAEIQNRKTEHEADASNIAGLTNPTFDDSGSVEGISSFPDFLTKFKSKVNIFQWFRDFKAGAQFILHAGQIVNNCVTNNAGLPLSAAQGKVLMDLINKQNGDFRNAKTIGTYSEVGIYATENVSKYNMLLFRIYVGSAYMFEFLPISVVLLFSDGGWVIGTENGRVTFRFETATSFQIADITDPNFKNITVYGL